MRHHSHTPHTAEVVIAGAGFGASCVALRLLQLNITPRILVFDRPDVGGIEILPAHVHPLLDILELGPVFATLKPTLATGLAQTWGRSAAVFRQGHALHIDRIGLRSAMRVEATKRGAVFERVSRLPSIGRVASARVRVGARSFLAAIDATGRRAAWSRPIVRYGRSVADLFAHRETAVRPIGEVVQLPSGWAYRTRHDGMATIGVVRPPGTRPHTLPPDVSRAFDGLESASVSYLGRRPAFAQAATSPVHGRRIAIGDAAFAHDPIGGRGLAFALGSAFAAAATVKSWWEHPAERRVATHYYRDYVDAERKHHLAFLTDFYGEPREVSPAAVPSMLKWRGRVTRAALNTDSGIAVGPAVRLPTGGHVRWLGRFDLLTLQEICSRPRSSSAILARLVRSGLGVEEAKMVMTWAFQKQLITQS